MATTVTLKPNAIDISGSTSGTTTLQATAVAGTTTLTLPAATDTLVGKATTDTLTNKTLTGAVMNGTVGATTPSTGAFTTLSSTGNSYFATSSGSVGIGTSSPGAKLDIVGATSNQIRVGTAATEHYRIGRNASDGFLDFYGSQTGYQGYRFGGIDGTWATIDTSGNLLVGKTSSNDTITGISLEPSQDEAYNFIQGNGAGAGWVIMCNRQSSDGDAMRFRRSNSNVGSISVTTTATAYNTSSDYRLKNTIAPMTGALAKVAALKPVTYKWKADGSDGEGFIAHELQAVCPDAVTGEKDAVDADGNPKYQGIDTSFLVATLTAAIQEQQALIIQLTARITALESA